MVYRTYIVWSCNVYIVVFPMAAVVANIALGVLTLEALIRVAVGADLFQSGTLTIRLRYYLLLTFIVNVVCSGLICWRIWRTSSEVQRITTLPMDSGSASSQCSYTAHVLDIIIQSAGFYCAHLLALIITEAIGTNVMFVFLDPLPSCAAIVFSMLLLVRGHGTCWTSLLEQVLIQSPPCAVNRGAYHYDATSVVQWQNGQRERTIAINALSCRCLVTVSWSWSREPLLRSIAGIERTQLDTHS
ncbi:hypothetical protein C8Q76DRAFT_405983 [Earliella scabrosa]|nr:hypothetical protein C8Q76DRAFT_405983 [Earliella scabrosa]